MKLFKGLLALLACLFFSSAMASSSNVKTTLIINLAIFTIPPTPPAAATSKIITDIQSSKLNVGRVIFMVNKPSTTEYAKTIIKELPNAKDLEIYIQPNPGIAWNSYLPKNPINCPQPPSGCLTGSQDQLKAVCNTINYANDMVSEGLPLTGIVYSDEGFPINLTNQCRAFVNQKLVKQVKNPDGQTALKLGWYVGGANPALDTDQADLSLIEFYDLTEQGSGPKGSRCAFDTVLPSETTICNLIGDDKKKGCLLFKSSIFPGKVFADNATPCTSGPAQVFIGSSIYWCSLNTPDAPEYCAPYQKVSGNSKSPADSIGLGFDFLLGSQYGAFQNAQSKYGNTDSTCVNTVIVFSTQYLGKLGATSNGGSTHKCINSTLQGSDIKTSSNTGFSETCGKENGFGVWSETNWPTQPNGQTAFEAFQQTTSNIITKVMTKNKNTVVNCQSDSTRGAAPIGIWQYNYIPQDWLDTPPTPAAQKTTSINPDTGAATQK
ncbi:MAG: hypothetical protein P1U34_03540 [Coxiellaceae bacterium]|nr:hypothetical protein [Coxiellaceae bacterium]